MVLPSSPKGDEAFCKYMNINVKMMILPTCRRSPSQTAPNE